MTLHPWKFLGKRSVVSGKIFRYSLASFELSDGRRPDFDLLDFADWVNVIALTKDGKLLLIRQYRIGTQGFTIEIPGGAINREEDPLEGAKRELLEETGYTTKTWRKIGTLDPNPAFQGNRCHVFLAEGVEKTHDVSFDEHEEIEVDLVEVALVRQMIKTGEITHCIVLAALSLYL
jgi:8-oxo-dGTP pyrophosphatase MutT (NUDIX family)